MFPNTGEPVVPMYASDGQIATLFSRFVVRTVRDSWGFEHWGQGYVLKTDAGSELLTAVAGVLGGDDFVSSGIETEDM